MIAGLLRIETRRTVAVWLAPLMTALAWWVVARPQLASPMVFWPDRSVQVLHVVAQIGPLLAAAGAWMAGRNRRCKIEDSITTTPYPPWLRELITCMAVVAWGLVVYLVIGSYIASATAMQGAWGTPGVGPILVGLLAVPAQGALGYAIGYRLPSRFTAPLVAVGLFVGQNIAGAPGPLQWYQFLSPGVSDNTSVQFGTDPDLSGLQILFVLGLTGVAIGSLGITGSRKLGSRSLFLLALILTGVSVALIQRDGQGGPFSATGITPLQFAQQLIPFRPVCANDRIPVCVHPAFKSGLPAITRTVNQVAAPIVGLPDAPTRALDGSIVQVMIPGTKLGSTGYMLEVAALLRHKGMTVYAAQPKGLITLNVDHVADLDSTLASQVAGSMVSGMGTPVEQCAPSGCGGPSGPVQEAMAVWLVQRAGFGVQWSELNQAQSSTPDQKVLAAAQRFAALPPWQQRGWLTTHFGALRSGQVSPAELP